MVRVFLLKFILTGIMLVLSIPYLHCQADGLYRPMSGVFDKIHNGLGNETLWNSVVSDLNDISDDLSDIDQSTLSISEQNSLNANLRIANILHDFLGEVSPYDGRNFDLDKEEFVEGIKLLKSIGVETEVNNFTNIFKLPLVTLTLWGQVNVLLVYNDTPCLHTFSIDLGKHGKKSAGVDRYSYRQVSAWNTEYPKAKVFSFTANQSDYREGCN